MTLSMYYVCNMVLSTSFFQRASKKLAEIFTVSCWYDMYERLIHPDYRALTGMMIVMYYVVLALSFGLIWSQRCAKILHNLISRINCRNCSFMSLFFSEFFIAHTERLVLCVSVMFQPNSSYLCDCQVCMSVCLCLSAQTFIKIPLILVIQQMVIYK